MGNDCCKRKEPTIRDCLETGNINKYLDSLKDPQSQFSKKKNKSSSTDSNNINSESKSSGIKSILMDKFSEDSKISENTNYKIKCQICEGKYDSNKSDVNSFEELKFCFECKKFFCENCWKEKHTEAEEETKKIIEHKFIPYIQKNQKCLKHGKDLIYFCEDCQEKICEDDIDHDRHEKKPISIDNNGFLAMILNQNKNNLERSNNLYENNNSSQNDFMRDYIKNALKNKVKFD